MQPLFREGTSVKPNDSARILAGFQHLPGHLDRPAQEALGIWREDRKPG
mgnify:CR=1 FL=1